MRDTPEILAAVATSIPALKAQILVSSEKWGRQAVEAGTNALVFALSVSEAHNRNNVKRHPLESAEDYGRLMKAIPRDIFIRLIWRRRSTARSRAAFPKRR